jgi:integrase
LPQKLTTKIARAQLPPARGNAILYDGGIKGFGLRTTTNGAKAFILNYHIAGRERRITIGNFDEWSVTQAREEAKRLRRQIDQGVDPLTRREEHRDAPTVADLWSEYEAGHFQTCSAAGRRDIRSMWRMYILPGLGSSKLKDITARHVDALHRSVSRNGLVRANRVIENLRSALALAIRWNWIDKNPAAGFRRNPEQPREMFLTEAEVTKLVACLEWMANKQAANAICLLILTGARLGEVLKAEWSQFDLERRYWIKPSTHTKQRRVHSVPLSSQACELLVAMQPQARGPYLFPSASGKPIADMKRPWAWLRKKMNLPQLRLTEPPIYDQKSICRRHPAR